MIELSERSVAIDQFPRLFQAGDLAEWNLEISGCWN